MSLTPQTITLDLNPSFSQMQTVHCSQYDDNIRQIEVKMKDGGTDIDVSSYTIYIEGTKPDKHGFSYPLTDIGSVSGNTVTFYIQLQMAAVPGMTRAEVVLKNGTDRIGSANFMLAVERAGLQDDTNTSDSELAPYINGAETAAQEAAQSASDAEAWAVGKRNGADVDDSDETYHNNAKYYSDQVSDALPSIQDAIEAVDDRIDGINLSYYETTNPITHAKTEVGIELVKDGQYSDVAIWGTNSTIPEATTSKNGWMSAQDKTDLTNAKTNITDLQGRATTLEGEMDTAQEDLEDLKTATSQIPTGSYPEMAVGNVFSDDSYTEDKTPYLYRVSGGGVEVGKVEADKIVGGSIVWNQSIDSYAVSRTVKGLTFTNNGTSISVSGTIAEAFDFGNIVLTNYSNFKRDGSKYLILLSKKVPYKIGVAGFTTGATNSDGFIWANAGGGTWSGAIAILGSTVGQEISIDNLSISVFNLTQMFGSAVADMIYAMETANAGAGVAFFHKMFPNAYYPYNAGELKSVEGLQSHDMVGFNLVDTSECIDGYMVNVDNGSLEINTATFVTGFIRVIKGQNYYIPNRGTSRTCLYDLDKNFIEKISENTGAFVYTANADGYIRVTANKSILTADAICINLSSDRNGKYEPYVKYSYPLDSSLILRGIPKVADGKMYYDGDVYSADGKVQREVGEVDLGTLTWTYDSANTRFRANIPTMVLANVRTLQFVCAKYYTQIGGTISASTDKVVYNANLERYIYIHDLSYTDAATFKTAMSGVMLVYELATPTEETAQAYTEYQKVSKYGTEEYVSTSIVPVGHVTKYPTDIVSKVDGLPSDFSTLIAPTEKGFTATRAYTVNQFLIVNNQLYRVTAAIASGATITPNTNVTAVTVADILTSLLNA